MARVPCATAWPSSTRTAGSRGPSGPGPSRSSSGLASQPRRELALLWPMVTRAADAAARSLTGDGLPGPAMDYWEDSVQVTLGTAAPLLAGLRAAADLAADVGGATATSDGRRWSAAAARLARASRRHSAERAISARLPPGRVPMRPSRSSGRLSRRQAPGCCRRPGQHSELVHRPNGGLRPGSDWSGTPDVAWTPETAFFALFDAATGSTTRHRPCWRGLPRTGRGWARYPAGQPRWKPASVAPLAWH